MSNSQIFVREFFRIHKRDFFLVLFLNIVTGCILNSGLTIHFLIYPLVILIVALKNFSFIRQAAIMPSMSSDFDRFSWKYFMGLPLNKKDIIQSLIMTNTITLVPLAIGIICYLPQIIVMFDVKSSDLTLIFGLKVLLFGIAFFMLTSIGSIKGIITLPRKEYSRLSPKIQFLQSLKKILLCIVITTYTFAAINVVADYINLSFLKSPLKILWNGFEIWMLIPASFFTVFLAYHNLLKTWQDEKAAYTKRTWNSKRDVPVCFASVSAIILPTLLCDFSMPSEYGNGRLQTAVYHNELTKVATLIKNENINVRSKNGYTPILIAAKEGHEQMFKLLVKNGANINDKIPSGNQAGANALHMAVLSGNLNLVRHLLNEGLSPNDKISESKLSALHLAAKSCRTEMVDLLIEKNADINSVDINNQSALHYAASRKCFPTLTALIDGGINPNIRSKNKNRALDLIKKKDSDIAYYLEKKSRVPASVKQ